MELGKNFRNSKHLMTYFAGLGLTCVSLAIALLVMFFSGSPAVVIDQGVTLDSGVKSLDFDKNCEVTHYVDTVAIIAYNVTYHDKNKSWTNISYVSGYNKVLKNRTHKECKEYVEIAGKQIEPSLQNFKCGNSTGEVICDSCIDGNCDSICDPNGGETCIKIVGGVPKYKNSVVGWSEKSANLPVKKLEV